ncbi:MAG: nitrile hydratase subunit beta [Acidiferrobacteraceae bacterium]|nr:nitrile hydratase subunit beta [Acidiferrobacteraceae bacterium]
MSGGHDLGGLSGLGPIAPEPESSEPVFHAEWEKRVFALTMASGFLRRWNLDESRHARERQHPADYLRNSYYENWLAGLQTLLVEKDLLSAKELATGASQSGVSDDEAAPLQAIDVPQILSRGGPVEMVIERAPCFTLGDRVRVCSQDPKAHTRAPAYVRGRVGFITAHHGAHVFADQHARGQRVGHHLYSVAFSSSELWGSPENGDTEFKVMVDLWEPHLELA